MMTKTLWITTSWHRPEALCLMGGTCCSRQHAARLCSASAGVTNQLLFPLDLVLYCEAFLTTYRTFITPEELIKKLQYRYEKFSPFADTFKKRVSKNTFFVLVRVVDELCLVELTEEILKLLMELVFRLVCSGELSLARVLRKNILDKVDQKKLLRCANSDQPLAARGVAARPGTLHDFHSHEIAEQLTLLDAELFYKIEIPEVLLWAKEQNEEKSPNLTQFTEHFNNMSYWVRSIIMLQEKAQDRERLLLKFIKIMKHLRKLNNFNSYLAILSALDSAPIRRLEWQKQTSEVSGRAGCTRDRTGALGWGPRSATYPAVWLGQPPHLSFLPLSCSHWAVRGFVVGAGVIPSQRPVAPRVLAELPTHQLLPSAHAPRRAPLGWGHIRCWECTVSRLDSLLGSLLQSKC